MAERRMIRSSALAMAETITRPANRSINSTEPQRFVIRLRGCRSIDDRWRIGNYLCRLPGGNTGSRAVTPQAALQFPSIQSAEEALAEHLSGLPNEKWDAVYEIVPLSAVEHPHV